MGVAPEPVIWGTEIFRDRLRGLEAQGVTNDLATWGSVQYVLAQGTVNKILTIRGLWMGLTSVLALARYELSTGFLLGPADAKRVSPCWQVVSWLLLSWRYWSCYCWISKHWSFRALPRSCESQRSYSESQYSSSFIEPCAFSAFQDAPVPQQLDNIQQNSILQVEADTSSSDPVDTIWSEVPEHLRVFFLTTAPVHLSQSLATGLKDLFIDHAGTFATCPFITVTSCSTTST